MWREWLMAPIIHFTRTSTITRSRATTNGFGRARLGCYVVWCLEFLPCGSIGRIALRHWCKSCGLKPDVRRCRLLILRDNVEPGVDVPRLRFDTGRQN